MKLLRKLFSRDSMLELEAIKTERDDLSRKNEALWNSVNSLEASARDQETRIRKLRTELDETKTKLREQTDADLLLISQRITAKILAGEKPEKRDVAEQQRLAAQRQMLNNPQTNIANLVGYNGLAGLSSVLGRPFGL